MVQGGKVEVSVAVCPGVLVCCSAGAGVRVNINSLDFWTIRRYIGCVYLFIISVR